VTARMYPFIDKKHFVGATFDPVEGHLDPWGVTQAYAKCASLADAEINRFNRVVDLKSRPDGGWDVFTEKEAGQNPIGDQRGKHSESRRGQQQDRENRADRQQRYDERAFDREMPGGDDRARHGREIDPGKAGQCDAEGPRPDADAGQDRGGGA
jgi:hypothetical protein